MLDVEKFMYDILNKLWTLVVFHYDFEKYNFIFN